MMTYFNKQQRKSRRVVERVFGILKAMFASLSQRSLYSKSQKKVDVYMAAIIFNMKLEARDKFDWGRTVSLEAVVHVRESASAAKEAGRAFRDALMRRMWADVMALPHHQ